MSVATLLRRPGEAAQAHSTLPISVDKLTKNFGNHVAVDELSFEVQPGRVTGFLGPNGAGKTTTLRMLLGLARPSSGTSLVFGTRYPELESPARAVGVLLDSASFHPRRAAVDHLRWAAELARVGAGRISDVLDIVELSDAADRNVGDFSLGMRQRLGLAMALLGDPGLLVLDEPANGLDPAGIRWLRQFMRSHVDEGGSVFVSSHQLAEISHMADDVVVIDHGRLVVQTSVAALTGGVSATTRVRTPTPAALQALLQSRAAVATVRDDDGETVRVRGLSAMEVGEIAAAAGMVLHELTSESRSLEDVFFELTRKDEVHDAAAQV